MIQKTHKILCILFKYLGDVVVSVPAVRALKDAYPNSEIHFLVPHDAVPLVSHIPWVNRAWGLPRKRGSASLVETLPLLAALRKERFDISVDFVGNDRGAIVSYCIGSNVRLGLITDLGFLGRNLCYNLRVPEAEIPCNGIHESFRHLSLVSRIGASLSSSLALEVVANPQLANEASELLEAGSWIGHLSTSQPKKEWPVSYWKELYFRARDADIPFVFASGPSDREQNLIEELRQVAPSAPVLKRIPDLDLYLAVLAKAGGLVSGDTGPLHFAAGLGVPTVGLFAPTDAQRWAPTGPHHRCLLGNSCACSGHAHVCTHSSHCMASLGVEAVWKEMLTFIPPRQS